MDLPVEKFHRLSMRRAAIGFGPGHPTLIGQAQSFQGKQPITVIVRAVISWLAYGGFTQNTAANSFALSRQ